MEYKQWDQQTRELPTSKPRLRVGAAAASTTRPPPTAFHHCNPCPPLPASLAEVHLLVHADVVGHVDQEGGVDGLGAKAQVADRHAARLMGVITKVGLRDSFGRGSGHIRVSLGHALWQGFGFLSPSLDLPPSAPERTCPPGWQ